MPIFAPSKVVWLPTLLPCLTFSGAVAAISFPICGDGSKTRWTFRGFAAALFLVVVLPNMSKMKTPLPGPSRSCMDGLRLRVPWELLVHWFRYRYNQPVLILERGPSHSLDPQASVCPHISANLSVLFGRAGPSAAASQPWCRTLLHVVRFTSESSFVYYDDCWPGLEPLGLR